MGVPKFFRYTSERYPCLNELVKQYQIPEFDNMYLDMNGIIHNCSHPDDSDPHFRITEEKIFKDIFHYISILFQIIKPKKLFFMAIDGVAPRAKMNQQRGRRFRSAREAERLEEEAKAKGEVLPAEKRFDSNCITPGTVFMARLHQQLRYFVKHKMSSDPLWSKVKVVLSGHETPGEGEHKIMDYIRWARSQEDYDPNTRHCLYGLDADLIMLGMCTHEPHFALLREEVKFGKTTQRATSPEETNFYLLHLSLLREYLAQEFISVKDQLPFEYDLEKIVDDWVLMGFLVGNDFIPHLPNMHISNDALPILYNTYMKVLPRLDGYINESGDLNLARFETFMQELAKIDREKFQDVYADLKYFEAKTGRRPNANERKEYKPNNDDTFNVNVEDIKNNKPDDELLALISATQDMFMDDVDDNEGLEYDETSDEEANIEMEFLLHKKDYYMNKLEYSSVTDEVLAAQAEGYVRAIQWNLFYYYKGCPSWCWYYPHHYAPYISDIKGFQNLKIEFDLGEPFKPFEQLLAVLPAASKHLLPSPFHELMTHENSPILHYYPVNFETDLNGKRNDWEAVVLIPFIDESNLLSAMAPCYQRLTDEELNRNTHGPMLFYTYNAESLGESQAPEYFPPIAACHAAEARVWRRELQLEPGRLRRGALPNAHRDLVFPGFPTMRHLDYRASLRKCHVKVFDQPSRNESMIVQIVKDPKEADKQIEELATELLGKVIWVGWPHLTMAKVIAVSNKDVRLHHIDKQNNNVNGKPNYSTEQNAGNLYKHWVAERATVIEHNINRLGIDLEEVKVLIHALNLKGYKYVIQDDTQMVREPEWCTVPCGYALQAVVRDVRARLLPTPARYCSLADAYPPAESVFLLTHGQYYGCRATVIDSEVIRSGRIKVQVKERSEPTPTAYAAATPYNVAHHAAAQCGISPQLLSRITGSVLVVSGERNEHPTEQLSKVNIGLNLKFNKRNLEVAGYTRRCKVSGAWLYSARCVSLVRAYSARHPDLFNRLACKSGNDIYFESDLWPHELGEKKPQEIQTWLKSQPHVTAVRRGCGSEALEPEEMKALWESLQKQLQELKDQEKKVTLHVKWTLLYKPELHEGHIPPDPNADFKIYDRVVCVSNSITVPMGATGTITAVYQPPASNTVRLSDKLNAEPSYQVMFDEPFPGAVTEALFEEPRFYRMVPTNMLNVSFGRKLRAGAAAAGPDPFSYSRAPAPATAPAPAAVPLQRDGRHSAFARYSPPTATPQGNAVTNGPPTPQDNGTNLLRTLLKISENDNSTKKNHNKGASDSNWRAKNVNSAQPAQQTQQQRRGQQQNWFQDVASKPQPAQGFPNDWSNSALKAPSQPPVLPITTFNQAFGGPVTYQIPYPQFQNPQYQQRNQFNQDYQRPQFNQDYQRPQFNQDNQRPQFNQDNQRPQFNQQNSNELQNAQGFPKHLPTVSGSNILLGPQWIVNQKQGNASHPTPESKPGSGVAAAAAAPTGADRVPNPFVPLQVQTSRRRVQNTGGQSSKKDDTSSTHPAQSQPQIEHQAGRQQNQGPAARPQKKKKTRIAANLPFQME